LNQHIIRYKGIDRSACEIPHTNQSWSRYSAQRTWKTFRFGFKGFAYTISHVPGKDLITADMLSRAPANNPTGEEQARQK
jgi:hypothetical protein